MEIEKFIQARKEKGLSQQEVAKDICTQATISRFENNGQVPSLRILTKLCQRVGINLEDLLPHEFDNERSVDKQMSDIEFSLIVTEYEKGWEILKKIPENNLKGDQKMRFFYLRGFLSVLQGLDYTDALFDFNQLLLEDNQKDPLYALLGYTGCGLVYSKKNQMEKAEFFFNKVFDQIQESHPIGVQDIWRTLTVLFFAGNFYANNKQLIPSNALLKHALAICQKHHVTYYVARIFLQLAVNGIEEKKEPEQIKEFLQDAWTFSKFNGNEAELIVLTELKKTYDF